jgi:hypothetical protein
VGTAVSFVSERVITQSLNRQEKKKSKHVNANVDIADVDVCERSKSFSVKEVGWVGTKAES